MPSNVPDDQRQRCQLTQLRLRRNVRTKVRQIWIVRFDSTRAAPSGVMLSLDISVTSD